MRERDRIATARRFIAADFNDIERHLASILNLLEHADLPDADQVRAKLGEARTALGDARAITPRPRAHADPALRGPQSDAGAI